MLRAQRFFVLICPALFFLGLLLSAVSLEQHALHAAAIRPAARPIPVIDAGHGGEDGGAVSLSGQAESGINLAIARRLELILGLLGRESVMLRAEDISLHSEGADTLRKKKVSDLHNRVDAVRSVEGAVLISIHQNSYPDPRYGGAQVFFAPTPGSEALACALQDALRALEPDNDRQARQIPPTIYLMNHVDCAAALVECGFLSNPGDEARLLDGRWQTKLAAAIAGGYLQYVGGEAFEDEDAVLLYPVRQ